MYEITEPICQEDEGYHRWRKSLSEFVRRDYKQRFMFCLFLIATGGIQDSSDKT